MSSENQIVKRPKLTEVSAATADDALSAHAGDLLPNTDAVLDGAGGDMAVYEKLLGDHEVFSSFQQRRRAVISKGWDVVSGGDGEKDKAAAEYLKEQLKAISFDAKTLKLLSGVFFGYAVAECLWEMRDGKVALADIMVRKAKRFAFSSDGSLRLLKANTQGGVAMPDRKFIVFTSGADDDDSPYGLGLAHYLYWPVYMKRNGAKFWAVYLDKFGAPSAIAKYPDNATDEDKATAKKAAAALRAMGSTAIPKGFELELLEALKASGGEYEKFMAYWDRAIVKVILSQTGTTDIGPYAGTAEVHDGVRLDVIKADADLVCEAINATVAVWLTEWNFPGAIPPKVWRVITDPEDEQARIDRDKALHEMGYEMTEERLRENYGDGWVKRAAASVPDGGAAPSPAFAEAEGEADEIVRQLAELAGDGMDDAIGAVRAIVMDPAITSMEELAERLMEAYPAIDMSRIALLLTDAMALGQLEGMDDADGK